jgi:hypothetical protein
VLTPPPGSKDHQNLHRAGVPMERDMNKYDLEHVCTAHGPMTRQEWAGIYQRAWAQYYSWEHIETLLRRAVADGIPAKRLMLSLVVFRGMPLVENVHPLQGGYFRRKVRRTRRPGMPSEKLLLFYPRHWLCTVVNAARIAAMACRVNSNAVAWRANTRCGRTAMSQSQGCRGRPRSGWNCWGRVRQTRSRPRRSDRPAWKRTNAV